MTTGDEHLAQCLDAHLDVEESVLQAVCEINDAMAGTLSSSGIKGPSEEELKKLEPLLTALRKKSEQSLDSRNRLIRQFDGPNDDRTPTDSAEVGSGAKPENEQMGKRLFARLSQRVPSEHRSRLDERRRSLVEGLAAAEATLSSNQVFVYYSMDFHRRYLMGVLHSTDQSGENAAYSADGQSFTPQPETLFGRNC